MTGTASEPTTSRSAGLDLLRAVACGLVVVFHIRSVFGVSFGPLDPVVAGADSGVYIFFALSGYLLYRPFMGRHVDLRTYAIKRAARILPGYYIALVGLTVLTGSLVAVTHPLPFLAIASSYSIPLRGFLGSAWTLSAELLFYVTLPLIVRLVRGHEVAGIGLIACASVSAAMFLKLLLAPSDLWFLSAYPCVAYGFAPGMLLAVVELHYASAFRRLASVPVLALGVALIAAGCVLTNFPIALGAGLGTPLVMGWLLQHRLPGARQLAFLGGASYAMYLWHKDVLISFGPLGLPIAILAATASWVIVERPILNWAHAITRGRPQRNAVALAVREARGPEERPAPAETRVE
jgi:peptidoglycan/LPS O-acetylase OafA/YrhL